MVKLGLPHADTKDAVDSYWLVTIRSDNNSIEKMEWFAQEKSLLVIRRGKAGPGQSPSMGWDLAGLAKQATGTANAPAPAVMAGMVVPDVSVEQMAKRADFTTYVFSKDPSWAGNRQITDILDVASPPHRMFLITYRAKDGRHVVFMQSFSYNKMLGPMVKTGKVVYTSPSGIKVWSGSARRVAGQYPLAERAGFHQGSAWEGTHRLDLGNSRRDISRPGHQRQSQQGRVPFADRQPCARQVDCDVYRDSD